MSSHTCPAVDADRGLSGRREVKVLLDKFPLCQIVYDGASFRDSALVACATRACEGVGVTVLASERAAEDIDAGHAFPDDFLGFPHVIEFRGPAASATLVPHAVISGVLQEMWGRGQRAVAICDFEDELPHAGGFRYSPPPVTAR